MFYCAKMHVITQSCLLFIWAHTLSVVTAGDCKREDFINGPDYDSHFDTTGLEQSYGPGTQVRVPCHIGFVGFFKLRCLLVGWTHVGSKCEPKTCGHPGDSDFAEFELVKGDDFVFGAEVQYKCQRGYQMVSRIRSRRCDATGWDGVVPVCQPILCPVIDVTNDVQIFGERDEATYGNVLRFSCKSRDLVLSGVAEIECDENGDWSDPAPTCIEVKCTPPPIDNGRVLGNIAEYNKDETLRFECHTKFRRSHHLPSKCTRVGMRADWIPTPLCDPVTCTLSLTKIPGTGYEPDDGRSLFSPDDTVTVICDSRYFIGSHSENTKVITCLLNGEWEISPVCEEITCNDPLLETGVDWTNDRYGRKRKLDNTVTYRCSTGYKATDVRKTAKCTRDGWTPKPLCEDVTCPPPPADLQANWQQNDPIQFGHTLTFRCIDTLKRLNGKSELTCGENGQWNDAFPSCGVPCVVPELPANVQITNQHQPSPGNGDMLQFQCTGRLYLQGSRQIKCLATGTWSDKVPICSKSNSCGAPLIPENAELRDRRESEYSDGEEVHYVCPSLYRVDGYHTCQSGQWIGHAVCLKPCTVTEEDLNQYNIKFRRSGQDKFYAEHNDFLTFVCKDGYRSGIFMRGKCINGEMTLPYCSPIW